jgi:hypothetical protein
VGKAQWGKSNFKPTFQTWRLFKRGNPIEGPNRQGGWSMSGLTPCHKISRAQWSAGASCVSNAERPVRPELARYAGEARAIHSRMGAPLTLGHQSSDSR